MITNKLRFVEEEKIPVAERKKRLREHMKSRRADNENRDVKEVLLCENLLRVIEDFERERLEKEQEKTVFIYLSFSSEAPTDLAIETLKNRGFTVLCPRVEEDGMQAVLCGDDFTLSHMGIREPVGKEWTNSPTYAVVPLLAVDANGNRLGYGKGYYDRYLAKHPTAKRIGYCYDFQYVREVPIEVFDERLDVIVTDKQVVYTRQDSRG